MARRRVKIKTPTTTTPPEVIYAGAGEEAIGVTETWASSGDEVTVRLLNDEGTFEMACVVSGTIARGTSLYGAANGQVSDAAVGSVMGVALEPGATGQLIEVAPYNVLSTTAGTVSVADTNNNMTGTNVETVLNELEVAAKTSKYTIRPDSIRLVDGTSMGKFADGVSGCGWYELSTKEMGIRWNNQATPDSITVQFMLPRDYDDTANVVVHYMGAIIKAGAGEVDSPISPPRQSFPRSAKLPAPMRTWAETRASSSRRPRTPTRKRRSPSRPPMRRRLRAS